MTVHKNILRVIFLGAVLLASLSFTGTDAFAQNDRREIRSGNRNFRKNDFRGADIDYRKALVKDSMSVAGNYNLASVLYRQNSFDEAGKYLGKAISVAVNPAERADADYNAGNVAVQKKDWEAAVKAYHDALVLNPNDMDAKENYIYAKKMLDNQKKNGGGGNNNQNQQDNKDNKDNQQNNQQDKENNQDNNQNQPQNQDQNQNGGEGQQPQPSASKVSPQQAQAMLQAIEAKEKETQDKVNKEKAAVLKSRQKEKNW